MRSVFSTSAWAASSSRMTSSLLNPTATPKGVMPRSSCPTPSDECMTYPHGWLKREVVPCRLGHNGLMR